MPGEKFRVQLVPEEGGQPCDVMVEVGMEGFNVLSNDGSRVLRKYPLHTISRWSLRGNRMILFTKSSVRALTLYFSLSLSKKIFQLYYTQYNVIRVDQIQR